MCDVLVVLFFVECALAVAEPWPQAQSLFGGRKRGSARHLVVIASPGGFRGYSGAGCVDQTTKIRKRVRQVQYEAAIVVWRGVFQGAHRSSGTEEQGTKRAKKQAAGCSCRVSLVVQVLRTTP